MLWALRTAVDLPGLDRVVYGVLLILVVLYSPEGVIYWPHRAMELLGLRSTEQHEDGE